MAPAVRILTLLVLAAALASGQPRVVLVALAVLLISWLALILRRPGYDWAGLKRMLWRVRWLLVAMLVLYGGFSTGEPVWPGLASIPTVQGLTDGALRITALVAIVAAVHLLMWTTARPKLLAGLLWFGAPLRRLGVDDRAFATRLVLTLEAVPQVQDLVRDALAVTPDQGRLARMVAAAGAVLNGALSRAERPPVTIRVPRQTPVPLVHWLIPAALATLFVAVAWTA